MKIQAIKSLFAIAADANATPRIVRAVAKAQGIHACLSVDGREYFSEDDSERIAAHVRGGKAASVEAVTP